MTIEEITQQADTVWDVATEVSVSFWAVSFGLFTPGALMAARQLAPAPVRIDSQNAPKPTR